MDLRHFPAPPSSDTFNTEKNAAEGTSYGTQELVPRTLGSRLRAPSTNPLKLMKLHKAFQGKVKEM